MARERREFVIDTLVVALTQLILKARGIVTLPLIVKLLGVAAYGAWAQVAAFTSFAGSLLSVNLHLPLVRYMAADRARAAEIFSSLLASTLVVTSLGVGVIVLTASPVAHALMGNAPGPIAAYLQWGALAMLFSNLRLLNLNVYRAMGRLMLRSAFELVTSLGALIGIFWVLSQGHGLLDVFIFLAVWEGGLTILQTLHCFVVTGWHTPRAATIAEAFRYALPLVPASLSVWALDRVDRFIVGLYHGAEGVGIYSAAYAVGGLLMLFQTPFQITLFPKVSALWDTDRAAAARYIDGSNKAFLTLAIPFVAAVPVVAPTLLTLLGNAEIGAASGWTTFFISLGVLFWGVGIMQTQIFHGAKRPGLVGSVTLATAAANVALNFILVPLIGVAGAALATAISYAATCVAFWAIGRRILAMDFDPRHLAACVLAAVGMALFLHVVDATRPGPLALALLAGVVIYFILLFALRAVIPGMRPMGLTLGRFSR